MTQQPDPTIPFDASVVDEEALRALRAVQRRLPIGDGGASGNLVGGTEAVAGFGTIPGVPANGVLAWSHAMEAPEAEHSHPVEGSLPTMLDPIGPLDRPVTQDEGLPEPAPAFVAQPQAFSSPKIVVSHVSSTHLPAQPSTGSAPDVLLVDPDQPDDQTGTPPDAEEPKPEEPVDITADSPVVVARDSVGLEDEAIGLDLKAALTDQDGSELLAVSILGLPPGASLSHGTRHADGSWSLAPSDLPHLTLTPPHNFSGRIDLTLQATARETNGQAAQVEVGFQVQVAAVADAPAVRVADARGQEDTPLRLDGLGGALHDTDGSESLSFLLSGLPAGARLSAGTRQADGAWLLTPAQLTGLTLTPPAHVSGRYTLTLTAVASESTGGHARSASDFVVELNPVADAATLGGTSSGAEDSPILLQPSFVLQDQDGSESWSALTRVSGLPGGASLSHGTQTAPGEWQVATADLRAGLVTLRPGAHSDEDFTLTLTATVTDTGNGTSVSREVTGRQAVTVGAVADAPEVHAGAAAGQEDGAVELDLSAALVDRDGSETLSVSILGLPDGFRLSHGSRAGDGSWHVAPADLARLSLTPPDNVSGTLNLTLQATAQEASGQIAKAIAPFTVTIDAVNDAPDLALTASKHAEEGASQAHAIDLAQAGDIDSSHLVGATITLSGGQPSERLDFDGFTLHDDGGRIMIGNTGIEVIGGGHAAGSGVLTLSGSALPETYATVLQSLVLESEDPSGLTAGTRSIGVVLRDSAGASSMRKSVDVVVEDATPAHAAGQGLDVSDSSGVSEVTAADILLLMADDGIGTSNDSTAAWTEQIDSSGAREAAPHHALDLDQPGTDHILIFDDLQSDAMRVSWS